MHVYIHISYIHSQGYINFGVYVPMTCRQRTVLNNSNDFFCANILEDQWRDKTKGLNKLIIVKQCVSRQWMDEEARRLRRIGCIKKIGF